MRENNWREIAPNVQEVIDLGFFNADGQLRLESKSGSLAHLQVTEFKISNESRLGGPGLPAEIWKDRIVAGNAASVRVKNIGLTPQFVRVLFVQSS